MLCRVVMRCDVRDPKVGDLVKLLRARMGIPTGTVALVVRFVPPRVVEIRLIGGEFKPHISHLYLKSDIKIL